MIVLEGKQIYIRSFTLQDAESLADLLYRNRRYWSIFEPRHPASFFTVETQRSKIMEYEFHEAQQREFTFGVYIRETNELIGHISMYGVKRLPFSSAFVGYSIDEKFAGVGYGSEALKLVVEFGMEKLGLHRLEAYVSPNNMASVRVLEKANFVREGLLRNLLYINGGMGGPLFIRFIRR